MNLYDIALSFAGEDRQLAETIAKSLIVKKYRVFYDNYEKHMLWGKDLTNELPLKYSQANFCIMLISDNYLEKMWTTLERQAIIEKFLKLKGNDYLLPVRLNGCTRKVPGLSSLTGYLSINSDSKTDVRNLILTLLNVLKGRLNKL